MTPQPIGAFIIVVDSDNNILLGERKNSYKSGFYGFPGGRLEPKESLIDCAKRELLEETGLKANALKYLGVIRTMQDGGNFIHFAFSCDDYDGKPELREPNKCLEWNFYKQNNLPTRVLPAHLAGIKLLNGVKLNFIDILSSKSSNNVPPSPHI